MRKCLILLFSVLWGAIPVIAEDPLTLDDAVKEAARNNPTLQAARETVDQAQLDMKTSGSNFLPQISADAGASKSQSLTRGGRANETESFSGGLSIRQSLFTGFENKANWDRQKALFAVAVADYDQVAAQLSYDLRRAFDTVLYTQRRLEVAKAVSQRRQENVRLVELKFEGGREHKGSYLRSRASYQQSLLDVSEIERDLRIARKDLARLMARDDYHVLVATGALGAIPPPPTPDFNELIYETPSYQQAAMRVQAAEFGVVSAKSQFYPDFSASGSLSRQGSDFPLDTERWSAGVNLSYPLFSGGRDAYGVKSSQSQLRQRQYTLEEMRFQVGFSLEDAYYAFQNAYDRIAVQQEFLNAALVRAEISRSQYANGLLSFEDWDIIENDLIQREDNLLTTLRDASIARANWDRVQGKGVIQ